MSLFDVLLSLADIPKEIITEARNLDIDALLKRVPEGALAGFKKLEAFLSACKPANFVTGLLQVSSHLEEFWNES